MVANLLSTTNRRYGDSNMLANNNLSRHLAQIRPATIRLPLVHVTPLSRFLRIAADGYLVPQTCPVLKREILYCSYGDIVFRPSRVEMSWDTDPAVVIILSPRLLRHRFAFAPLDTGAIATGRVPWFPSSARKSLDQQYCIADSGGKQLGAWISEIYGSDKQYINRSLAAVSSHAPEELQLARGLAEAVCAPNMPDHTRDDMRVISQIECHFSFPIPLNQYLLGIYTPDETYIPGIPKRIASMKRTYRGDTIAGNLPKELVALVRMAIEKCHAYQT